MQFCVAAVALAPLQRLSAHTIGAVRKVLAKDGVDLPVSNGGAPFHVKQGSYIGISHIVPHHNNTVYPNSRVFGPERFTDRDYTDYELTTFSHGLHRCPGKRLAMLQMKGAIHAILSRYTVSVVAPIPTLDFERATLAQRAAPCPLRYRRTR